MLNSKKLIVASTLIFCLSACKPGDNLIINLPGEKISNTLLISVPSDNQLNIFDTVTNRNINTFKTDDKPEEIAISPDNRQILIINANSGTVSCFLRRDNQNIIQLNSVGNGDKATGIVFNPTFPEAYVSYPAEEKLLILDTKNSKAAPAISKTISLPGSQPGKIAVSTDGKQIYIADQVNSRILILYKNGSSFSRNASIPFSANSSELQISDIVTDENKLIYLANSKGNSIIIYDPLQNLTKKVISLKDNQIVRNNDVGPQNILIYTNNETKQKKLYVSGNYASVVSVIDLNSENLIKNIPLNLTTENEKSFSPVGLALAHDGNGKQLLYITNAAGKNISIIDPGRDVLVKNISDSLSLAGQSPLGEVKTLGAVL